MTVQTGEARSTEAREVAAGVSRQRALYDEAAVAHAAAVARLARAYEADAELCRDLEQDIHVALWRSFTTYDGRCSLRTWVFRVAHNVACSHVMAAQRRRAVRLVDLDELDRTPATTDPDAAADRRIVQERLLLLIQQLAPIDRQAIVLHLEGMDAAAIAEITGLSESNVNTKLHRIRKILAERVKGGK